MSANSEQPPNTEEHPIFSMSTGPCVAATLSTVSCFVILLTFIKRENKSNYWERMAFWLILGGFIYFLPKVINCYVPVKSNSFCTIMAVLIEIGGNSAFFWTSVFAHSLYSLSKYKDIAMIEKSWPYYFSFAVIFPILYGLAICFTDFVSYDQSEEECTHYVYAGQVDVGYIAFIEIPTAVALLLTIVWYSLAVLYLYKHIPQEKRLDLLALALFPGILIICQLPILTASMIDDFHSMPSDLLKGFQTLGNLNGFFDALVYGGSLKSFRNCFKAKRKDIDISDRDQRLHSAELGVVETHRKESMEINLSI